MTDNSAEKEAERILQEEADRIRAEQCPQGTACAVHFRNDEVIIDDDEEYARLITYVGDYVVITEDNPKFHDPILMAIAISDGKRYPPTNVTTVLHVGQGVIGDLANGDHRRYWREHEYEEAQEVHSFVVSGVSSGLLDVSKPWKE
jgi:hypothetical protein